MNVDSFVNDASNYGASKSTTAGCKYQPDATRITTQFALVCICIFPTNQALRLIRWWLRCPVRLESLSGIPPLHDRRPVYCRTLDEKRKVGAFRKGSAPDLKKKKKKMRIRSQTRVAL